VKRETSSLASSFAPSATVSNSGASPMKSINCPKRRCQKLWGVARSASCEAHHRRPTNRHLLVTALNLAPTLLLLFLEEMLDTTDALSDRRLIYFINSTSKSRVLLTLSFATSIEELEEFSSVKDISLVRRGAFERAYIPSGSMTAVILATQDPQISVQHRAVIGVSR
jgi:hypothetical protein